MTNQKLPPFKPATPNRPKAPAAPKRGSKEWSDTKALLIVDYVREHNGKAVKWSSFAKACGLNGKELGQFLRAMLKAKIISQSDPTKYVYAVKAQLKRVA